MARLKLTLLGPFQASFGNESEIHFPTDKVRALLAYLAVEADRPHRRDTLAALLWPESPQRGARHNLRNTLHRLQEALNRHVPSYSQSLFRNTHQTLCLDSGELDLDVADFQALSATAQPQVPPHHGCNSYLASLDKAANIYRGEFLQGFSLPDALLFDEWQLLQREQFHNQIVDILQELASAYETSTNYLRAHEYASRLLILDPWREHIHRQVMRLLAFTGQTHQALAHFERYRTILATELNVTPATETLDLVAQIRVGTLHSSAQSSGSDLVQRSSIPAQAHLNNFPTHVTDFLGRESELEQICQHLTLANCRLLTLMGLGGVGKTRLAIQAAEELAKSHSLFPDGIYFVPLERIAAATQIDSLIAAGLGYTFQGQTATRKQLLGYLHNKELLLLLDNFEHLAAAADYLTEMLTATQYVKVLVTSRQPLNIRLEWRMPIEGLTYPHAETEYLQQGDMAVANTQSTNSTVQKTLPIYSAVQLFMQTARQIVPGFDPTPKDRQAILQICRAVEGTPLALEVAATWLRMVDCTQIAREIAHNIDFLVTPLRDLPERHRSMRAVFEHSWQMLTSTEQQTLAQLSIFRGGFTLDAGLAITDSALSVLPGLLDKALLTQAGSEHYTLHELARQFASEKLQAGFKEQGLAFATSIRHSHYYLKMLAEQGHLLKSPEPQPAVSSLQRELGNIRQAWQWALDQADVLLVQGSIDGLAAFYEFTGLMSEGEAAFRDAAVQIQSLVSHPPYAFDQNLSVVLNRLLCYQAKFLTHQGKYGQASNVLEQALRYSQNSEDGEGIATCLARMGVIYRHRGEYEQAKACLTQALTLDRTGGHQEAIARDLGNLGLLYWNLSDYGCALDHLQEALEIEQQLDNIPRVAYWLGNLGVVHRHQGDYAQALACHEQALQLCRELGLKANLTRELGNIGNVCKDTGAYGRALECYQEAFELSEELGQRRNGAYAIAGIAIVYQRQGDYGRALDYFTRVLNIDRQLGNRVAIARHLGNMGLIYSTQGAYERALETIRHALQIDRELGNRADEAIHQSFLGQVYAVMGEPTQAIHDLERSEPTLRKLSIKYYLAENLLMQAQVYHQLEQGEVAQMHATEGQLIAEEIGCKVVLSWMRKSINAAVSAF